MSCDVCAFRWSILAAGVEWRCGMFLWILCRWYAYSPALGGYCCFFFLPRIPISKFFYPWSTQYITPGTVSVRKSKREVAELYTAIFSANSVLRSPRRAEDIAPRALVYWLQSRHHDVTCASMTAVGPATSGVLAWVRFSQRIWNGQWWWFGLEVRIWSTVR